MGLGPFIHDQILRRLNPAEIAAKNRTPDGLKNHIYNLGEVPLRHKLQNQVDADAVQQKADRLWPLVEPNRLDFLGDLSHRRIVVTEAGGYGKSIVLHQLEYATRMLNRGHLVMRFEADQFPASQRDLIYNHWSEGDGLSRPPLFIGHLVEQLEEANRSDRTTHLVAPRVLTRSYERTLRHWLLTKVNRGDFTLIIDAFDQMDLTFLQDRVKKVIGDFLRLYPNTRCVIAGRPESIRHVMHLVDLDQWREVETRNADGSKATEKVPVWQYCQIDRFHRDQVIRYLGEQGQEKLEAARSLGVEEICLPRTLAKIRELNVEQIRSLKSVHDLYFFSIYKSLDDTVQRAQQNNQDRFAFRTDDYFMVISAIAIGLMFCSRNPVTRVVKGAQYDQFLKFLNDLGILKRIHRAGIDFQKILQELNELDTEPVRVRIYFSSRHPALITIHDRTILDFFAAHWCVNWMDSALGSNQRLTLKNELRLRLPKIYAYPESASANVEYQRFWELLVGAAVEHPLADTDDSLPLPSNSKSYVEAVSLLFEQPAGKTLRPTELMYRAWPNLMSRCEFRSDELSHSNSSDFDEVESKEGEFLLPREPGLEWSETVIAQATTWVQRWVRTRFSEESDSCGLPRIDEDGDEIPNDAWHQPAESHVSDDAQRCRDLVFEFLAGYWKRLESGNRVLKKFEEGFQSIPAGYFHYGNREPVVRKVNDSFCLNAYQVTNELYDLFDANHRDSERFSGYQKSNCRSPYDDGACIHKTWFDAWAFSLWCGGRMASEVEWEGACRGQIAASKETLNLADFHPFYFLSLDQTADLKHHAWFDGNSILQENANAKPNQFHAHSVGYFKGKSQFVAHPYGLYDMHGNVWEWCSDWWNPSTAASRVLRGGSYDSASSNVESGVRNYTDLAPRLASYLMGIRVARAYPEHL